MKRIFKAKGVVLIFNFRNSLHSHKIGAVKEDILGERGVNLFNKQFVVILFRFVVRQIQQRKAIFIGNDHRRIVYQLKGFIVADKIHLLVVNREHLR